MNSSLQLRTVGFFCLVVGAITLSLGLWPYHVPANGVSWLRGLSGVQFQGNGVVWNSGFRQDYSLRRGSCIEIWVQPDHWSESATLLTLYRQGPGVLVRLRQSLTDLEVSTGGITSFDHQRARLLVTEAFGLALRRNIPVVITVDYGLHGTRVYLNGALSKQAEDFHLPEAAISGQLILGDSPGQPDSFRGRILGVALYGVELDSQEVMRHYQEWVGSGSPNLFVEDQNVALYRFAEGQGAIIHNERPGGGNLQIPPKYAVIDKIALEPFWDEFDFSWNYWSGNLKNIIGFVPLGFSFAAFGYLLGLRRPVLATVLAGTLVSIIIEVGQILLPMRDSGTTDLFTNALGTYLGIVCYTHIYPRVVLRIPSLGWFARQTNTPPAHPSAWIAKQVSAFDRPESM